MSEAKCPYCDTWQEIDHDGGYGLDMDAEHEQDCVSCNATFKFTTCISYDYEVFCNGDHAMEQSPVEGCSDFWECSRCSHSEIRANTATEGL